MLAKVLGEEGGLRVGLSPRVGTLRQYNYCNLYRFAE